jgi:hypothetical protein
MAGEAPDTLSRLLRLGAAQPQPVSAERTVGGGEVLPFCGHEGISRGMGSRQGQPLQAIKPFEIAINTHQAPAIGDRQSRQMGIGAVSAACCSE